MSETGGETRRFRTGIRKSLSVGQIMLQVHAALVEKGYDPISQITGFILSGDPAYITNHKGARSLVHGLDRDEIVEELLRCYLRVYAEDGAPLKD